MAKGDCDRLWDPTFPHERAEVPEGVEDCSPAAWDEYQACSEALEARLQRERSDAAARNAKRRPSDAWLAGQLDCGSAQGGDQAAEQPKAPPPTRRAAGAPTAQAVLMYTRMHQRICPLPAAWERLHESLALAGAHPSPPAPISAIEWARSSDFAKQARMRDQVEWAARHGLLPDLLQALLALHEDDWHQLPALSWPSLDC